VRRPVILCVRCWLVCHKDRFAGARRCLGGLESRAVPHAQRGGRRGFRV